MSLIVFKVGGSLLDLPRLPSLLRSVLCQRPGADPLFVVGGGGVANVIRDWDRIHQLGEERAHWLALKSLRVSEALLLQLLPGSNSVSSHSEFQSARKTGLLPILNADSFLRDEERGSSPRLPHSWDVTSDSIAVFVAQRWGAAELVLLKSTVLPDACTIYDAVQAGLVDRHFSHTAAAVPQVSWANLRDSAPQIVRWEAVSQ